MVLMSDTHNRHDRLTVPEGDIVIHAGDATWGGTYRELKPFAGWFSGLPHKHKVMVAGNHDDLLSIDPEIVTSLGIHYLAYASVTLEGLLIYGGPFYTVPDKRVYRIDERWAAFKISEVWAERAFSEAPSNPDIVVTHRPPRGTLDWVIGDGVHGGSLAVKKYVERVKPRLHVFGHIHDSRGKTQTPGTLTLYVNAACHDENMNFVDGCYVVDL